MEGWRIQKGQELSSGLLLADVEACTHEAVDTEANAGICRADAPAEAGDDLHVDLDRGLGEGDRCAKGDTAAKRAEQRQAAQAELDMQMDNWRELQNRHEARPHDAQLQYEVGAARARTEKAAQGAIKVTAAMVERVMGALRAATAAGAIFLKVLLYLWYF